MWPDRRLLDLFGIELPIVQAPMAGATDAAMAVAVSRSGGLGSLPCALLTAERTRAEIGVIRQRTGRPLNVNTCVAGLSSMRLSSDRPPARERTQQAASSMMVEAAGIEPASASTSPSALHA